jgi:hypothetical protein
MKPGLKLLAAVDFAMAAGVEIAVRARTGSGAGKKQRHRQMSTGIRRLRLL